MTALDIIEFAELLQNEIDYGGLTEDTPVLLAQQPNWPLQYHADQIAIVGNRIYISQGEEGGYLADDAKEELDW